MSEIKLLYSYENDADPIESDQIDDWEAFRIEEQELDAQREEREQTRLETKPEPQGQMKMIVSSDGTSFEGFGIVENKQSSDESDISINTPIDVLNRDDFLYDKTDLLRKAAKQIRYSNAKKKSWDRTESKFSYEDRESARKRAEKNIGKACVEFCGYFDGKSCKINPVVGSGSIINHLDDFVESTNFLRNLDIVEKTRADMKCSDLVKKPLRKK